jgi:hypothetical protein
MTRKIRVIAGPHRTARKYAISMGWDEGDYIIVTRGHQLAQLDPSLILSIFTIQLYKMGKRVQDELEEEIKALKFLWPIPTVAAA